MTMNGFAFSGKPAEVDRLSNLLKITSKSWTHMYFEASTLGNNYVTF